MHRLPLAPFQDVPVVSAVPAFGVYMWKPWHRRSDTAHDHIARPDLPEIKKPLLDSSNDQGRSPAYNGDHGLPVLWQ
jgi:hypothetical protein